MTGHTLVIICYHYIQYGGLLKWGYPQIIRSNMIFQQINHPFGVPPCMETPISLLYVYLYIIYGRDLGIEQHWQQPPTAKTTAPGSLCSLFPLL
jgi:hypothetical protein